VVWECDVWGRARLRASKPPPHFLLINLTPPTHTSTHTCRASGQSTGLWLDSRCHQGASPPAPPGCHPRWRRGHWVRVCVRLWAGVCLVVCVCVVVGGCMFVRGWLWWWRGVVGEEERQAGRRLVTCGVVLCVVPLRPLRASAPLLHASCLARYTQTLSHKPSHSPAAADEHGDGRRAAHAVVKVRPVALLCYVWLLFVLCVSYCC
jgi:hypothetical protein